MLAELPVRSERRFPTVFDIVTAAARYQADSMSVSASVSIPFSCSVRSASCQVSFTISAAETECARYSAAGKDTAAVRNLRFQERDNISFLLVSKTAQRSELTRTTECSICNY